MFGIKATVACGRRRVGSITNDIGVCNVGTFNVVWIQISVRIYGN